MTVIYTRPDKFAPKLQPDNCHALIIPRDWRRRTYQCTRNGKIIDADGNKWCAVHDPAAEQARDLAQQAQDAHHQALKTWQAEHDQFESRVVFLADRYRNMLGSICVQGAVDRLRDHRALKPTPPDNIN